MSIHEARFEAGKPFRFIFKVAFEMHVQKRVLPLHPHLLNVVTSASLSSLAALLAVLQPAPSPLTHSRSSPAADARPLYATVLAVAGNAAGMCSGTVLFIDIIKVINHILSSVGILQNIFIHFCIVQSSFLFVSFQVLAVGHRSYCLLCYCQLWHAVTVYCLLPVLHSVYCVHCLPSVILSDSIR